MTALLDGAALDAIEARANAATEGPWTAYNNDLWQGVTEEQLVAYDADPTSGPDPVSGTLTLFHGAPERFEDAVFIATAREFMLPLVAEVRRLRIALTEAQAR